MLLSVTGCWGSAAAARAALAWRDMRWRAAARAKVTSASVMVASGAMMASGWGRQVLRSDWGGGVRMGVVGGGGWTYGRQRSLGSPCF